MIKVGQLCRLARGLFLVVSKTIELRACHLNTSGWVLDDLIEVNENSVMLKLADTLITDIKCEVVLCNERTFIIRNDWLEAL